MTAHNIQEHISTATKAKFTFESQIASFLEHILNSILED